MIVLYLKNTHSHCTDDSFRQDYLFNTNSFEYQLCVLPKRGDINYLPNTYSIGKVQCSKCYIETPRRAVDRGHDVIHLNAVINVTPEQNIRKLKIKINTSQSPHLTHWNHLCL